MVIRTEKVILKRMRKFLQIVREENESRIHHNSKPNNGPYQYALLQEPCMYSYEVFLNMWIQLGLVVSKATVANNLKFDWHYGVRTYEHFGRP